MIQLSFIKKNRSKVRWHPDFRFPERLPDIKPIRTKFIINVACVGIALFLLSMVIGREFTKGGIRGELSEFATEQSEKLASNSRVVQLSDEFHSVSQKFDDAIKFKKQPIHPILLISELSKVCPADLIYDRIQYQQLYDGGLKLEIYQLRVGGIGKTTASIGELKERLAGIHVASGYVITVAEQGNPTKDALTGNFSFQIVVNISADPNAKK